PPPYQNHRSIYTSSYSGPHSSGSGISSYSAAAASAVAVATHARYKRQASSNNRGGSGGGNSNQIPIEPVCPRRVILIEPKAALNDKRQWKFIVNLSERDPRLKQAIKVEVCT